MKYKLKDSLKNYRSINQVCINCGKKITIKVSAMLPLPNTTEEIIKGFLGPMPGTWLGCKLGNHRFYFEHEVGKVGENI